MSDAARLMPGRIYFYQMSGLRDEKRRHRTTFSATGGGGHLSP